MYRVRLFPLFKNMSVTTLAGGQTQTKLDLDVPGFRDALIQAEAIFLVTVMDAPAGNVVDWNIEFISGLNRQHERNPVPIVPTAFTNPGVARSADYNTTTEFLPESRLQLWYANHLGVTSANTAVISAIVGVRMLSQ